MSREAFITFINTHAENVWFKETSQNIVKMSAEKLRASQQIKDVTDFAITQADISNVFFTITGQKLPTTEAKTAFDTLANAGRAEREIVSLDIGNEVEVKTIVFKGIGFKAITDKINTAFTGGAVGVMDTAYQKAINTLKNKLDTATNADTSLSAEEKTAQLYENEIKSEEVGTLGYYINKGHVISIGTNLYKQFKEEISDFTKILVKNKEMASRTRREILVVLLTYIRKLEKEDLSHANLPNQATTGLYAGYRKTSKRYLVELQSRVSQQLAGSLSAGPIGELKKLFTPNNISTANILAKSPTFNRALIQTQGSPSFLDLMTIDIASLIKTGKIAPTKEYVLAPTFITEVRTKIKKPKSNKKTIANLKGLVSKLKAADSAPKKNPVTIKVLDSSSVNLTSLQGLINQHLQNVIAANMGDGSQNKILNYRTGRFASTVKVDRMSESRQGMITAFYSYMKNPYSTFAEGGRQQDPTTRNPKLLIAKSIREIAAIRVGNRLRAVAL